MKNIFRKRYSLYKIIERQELVLLVKNNFKEFGVTYDMDFRVFTSQADVIKYAYEYQKEKNFKAIFYAEFETDIDCYNRVIDNCDTNNFTLFSEEQIYELNSRLKYTFNQKNIFVRQVFEFNGSLFDVPLWVVLDLLKCGVVFDEKYFEYICSHQRPFKNSEMNLFVGDVWNKRLKKQLGRIVVYKEEPTIYEDVLSAVFDNYEKKYKFGFEKLHEAGIIPAQKGVRRVNKFGVNINEPTAPPEHPSIKLLNESISNIYQWISGKSAAKCYNDPIFRNQDDGQTFEEFKEKEVRYRCFMALSEVALLYKHDEQKSENTAANEKVLYLESIEKLLRRYVHDGDSVFQKIDDLNECVNCSGIYILCFDYEKKIYVGQTKKCLKERIVQHFTKPQSNFDKNHSLEEVTSIYVLNVTKEYLDCVEADCIATISPNLLFNVFAGGSSIEMITSETYNPKRYLLEAGIIELVSAEANSINSLKKKTK